MTSPSKEEIQEILAPLDAYYEATPLEFSIGLQNFQSIRQYTKIPLSPITLIYGQNSAGKSAIHDALIFLHDLLSNKSIPKDYLDRWANRQRINRPLSKGFIGRAEDVVISIDAWGHGWGMHNFDEATAQPGGTILRTLWDRTHTFQLRFHFSYYENDGHYNLNGWVVRELHLFLGTEEFLYFQHPEDSDKNERGFLSINTEHLLFEVISQLCGQKLDVIAKESEFLNGETKLVDNWLQIQDVRLNNYVLEWRSDDLGSYEPDLNEYYHLANIFRNLISGMIEIPSAIAAEFTKLDSVPPLRPVPTKYESCFRLLSSDDDNNSSQSWKRLAIDIRDKEFYYLWERFQPDKSHIDYLKEQDSDRLINYVNHVLQHPFFLDAGYEVTGECNFLLSAKNIEELQNDVDDNFSHYAHEFESEVKLKLNSTSDKIPVEI